MVQTPEVIDQIGGRVSKAIGEIHQTMVTLKIMEINKIMVTPKIMVTLRIMVIPKIMVILVGDAKN